jgi:hypothetical protein
MTRAEHFRALAQCLEVAAEHLRAIAAEDSAPPAPTRERAKPEPPKATPRALSIARQGAAR